MNRILLWLGIAAGMLLGFGSLQAAPGAEKPPVPPSPLFRALLPAGVVCKVVITRPALERLAKEGKLPPGLPGVESGREITPGKGITRVRQKFSDGRTLAAYYTGGVVLVENAKGNCEIHTPKGETWQDDFGGGSFPELSWVTAADYQGVQKRGDQEFHCYEGLDAHSRPQRLYVDTRNLLPALFESARGRYVYRYRDAGEEKIALPEKLAQAWQVYRKNKDIHP